MKGTQASTAERRTDCSYFHVVVATFGDASSLVAGYKKMARTGSALVDKVDKIETWVRQDTGTLEGRRQGTH